MIGLGQELRLFLRQRLAGPTLALLAVLSAISIGAGMLEIRRQTEAIARIQPLQAAEEAAVAAKKAVKEGAMTIDINMDSCMMFSIRFFRRLIRRNSNSWSFSIFR